VEGLEVSVVALSKVRVENPTARIDSTYFGREALAIDERLRVRPHSDVGTLSSSVLSFGAYALTNEIEYQESGIPFLRCADFKNGFVSFADTLNIDAAGHRLLHKSEIQPETVLLTMSGSIGQSAVALPEWSYPLNSNQDVAKICAKGISPYYLSAFLSSRFGKAQMQRLPVGSVQQHIFLSMIESLIVARLDDGIEQAIAAAMRSAYLEYEAVNRALAEAEATLGDALGLRGWSPPDPLAYTASAAFVSEAGRLDAEFAAPKVRALLRQLSSNGSTVADFANVRHDKFKAIQPGTFQYIEIGDLDGLGRCVSSTVDCAEAPSRATWHVRTGDVITSTVRPIRRLSAIISPIQDGDVCSSGFVVLEPVGASSELLMTYLRLPLVAELMHLFATASMYPALSEADLLALPMPTVNESIDSSVQKSVQVAFDQLRKSESLRNAAMRAVEIAIDESEAAALAFITQACAGA
jgi:hypothetical protein